jgi:hypothetical protein
LYRLINLCRVPPTPRSRDGHRREAVVGSQSTPCGLIGDVRVAVQGKGCIDNSPENHAYANYVTEMIPPFG